MQLGPCYIFILQNLEDCFAIYSLTRSAFVQMVLAISYIYFLSRNIDILLASIGLI